MHTYADCMHVYAYGSMCTCSYTVLAHTVSCMVAVLNSRTSIDMNSIVPV
jgi:hypothetical protein